MAFLQIHDFAAHVNESFMVDLGGGPQMEWTLLTVSPLPVRTYRDMVRSPFRLTFKSSHLTLIPQKSYPMKNAGLGTVTIFVTPVARAVDGMIYEAIFT
jgi:hypothetical protein